MTNQHEGNLPEIGFNITADLSMRSGVYSNFFMVNSNGKEAILDFCFNDQTVVDPSGKTITNGIVVSRVIMTSDGLERLRDMLDKHIENAKKHMPGDNHA